MKSRGCAKNANQCDCPTARANADMKVLNEMKGGIPSIMTRAQWNVAALGVLLLLGLVLCPKWELRTQQVRSETGGEAHHIATTVITWHRWMWSRPADAVGIAWLYMAKEAAVIAAGTVIAITLLSVVPRRRS